MSGRLPYGRQDIGPADVEAVTDCLRSDFLTQGPRVEAFETALCETTGASHAVVVSSGTAALHLAVLGLGLGPGDRGLTAAITFVASANALRYAGAEVGFADVDPRTGLMDVSDLARRADAMAARGEPPRLIVPVHLNGQAPELARIRSLADRHGAAVLEDAAHALGSSYTVHRRRYRVGSCAHSQAAILSFHPVKHVTTGEGGAVLTNDAALAARVRELRSHGIHRDSLRLSRGADDPMVGPWYYEQTALGYNYRLPDLLCALGLSQLQRLPEFLASRRALAALYDHALSARPFSGILEPVEQLPDREHAYHLYVVRVVRRPGEPLEGVAQRRKHLYGWLRDRDILAQVHYIPVPWQPFHGGSSPEAFPGSAAYYASCLSLPLYPSLAPADVDRVCEALAGWAALDAKGTA